MINLHNKLLPMDDWSEILKENKREKFHAVTMISSSGVPW